MTRGLQLDRRGDHPVAQGARQRAPIGGSRRSIRFPAFDYSSSGAYFVTTCTQDRHTIFADTKISGLIEKAWNWLPHRFPQVSLDEFVIMPDHVHFVIWLLSEADYMSDHPAAQGARPRAPMLGNVIGAFKTVAARSINALRGTTRQRVWQRNYFEHVIRNENELQRIREYVNNNPLSAHYHESDDLSEAWVVNAEP